MQIGVPRESKLGETLVAATAKTVTQLAKLGFDVIVESAAGESAGQSDTAFVDGGARVGNCEEVWAADVVVKVNAPTDDKVQRLRSGVTIISMMAPARSPELLERLRAQKVTAFAMGAVPRMSYKAHAGVRVSDI